MKQAYSNTTTAYATPPKSTFVATFHPLEYLPYFWASDLIQKPSSCVVFETIIHNQASSGPGASPDVRLSGEIHQCVQTLSVDGAGFSILVAGLCSVVSGV